MELLTCTKCREEKPQTLEFFPPHNKKKNGLDSWCRKCRGSYRSEIRRGNYRNSISDSDLKNWISSNQNCMICGKEEKLVVDHDHETGKVRGLLCNHCNRGLGHFRDSVQFLDLAAKYLKDRA
jgi:hypothetical protein